MSVPLCGGAYWTRRKLRTQNQRPASTASLTHRLVRATRECARLWRATHLLGHRYAPVPDSQLTPRTLGACQRLPSSCTRHAAGRHSGRPALRPRPRFRSISSHCGPLFGVGRGQRRQVMQVRRDRIPRRGNAILLPPCRAEMGRCNPPVVAHARERCDFRRPQRAA